MKKIISLVVVFFIIINSTYAQNGWVQLANYPGGGKSCLSGFQFQYFEYTGMGYSNFNSSNTYSDFWAYNPITQLWIQKANFIGSSRYNNCSFSIGKYGFITLGCDGSNYFSDLWQYDQSTNLWAQKANFPGAGRYGAVAFGTGNTGTKGFAGLGEQDNGNGITDYLTDFYEYDQPANTWIQRANFPGQGRFTAFSFYVNNLFYVVGGRTENLSYNWVYLKDMWAYNPVNNTWTQKASYPGSASFIYGFVINNCAYAGLGFDGINNYDDFWRYNPVNDTWTQLPDFPGGARRACFCFSVNNTGYLGCGQTESSQYYDFWKYNDPIFVSVNNNVIENNNINVYPTLANESIYIESKGVKKVEIYTYTGSLCKEVMLSESSNLNTVNICSLISGLYLVKITTANGIVIKKIIKN